MKWNDTLETIYKELASESPAPGGGSASALSGFIACGLINMLVLLNPGADSTDIQKGDTENFARLFTDLAEKDAQAYLAVAGAYKMPKNNDEEKSIRISAIQSALINAAKVPVETATLSVKLLDLLINLGIRLKRSMASDFGVAFILLQTCFMGAMMNVRINLPGIKDVIISKEIINESQILLDEWKIKSVKAEAILKDNDIYF